MMQNKQSKTSLPTRVDDFREGLTTLELSEWISSHREALEAKLLAHGALLFRGARIASAEDFGSVVTAMTPELLSYTGGGSPRSKVSGRIYTSTEYVGTVHIPLHCEMSYTPSIPGRIWFFCQKKSQAGGSTPLGYLADIGANLPIEITHRFQEKGVRYTAFMHHGAGFGKSWQKTYETDDKDEVSALLEAEEGLEYEWKKDGLFVSRTHPSHRRHSVTEEVLWYNQAVNWHPAHLGLANFERLGKVFGRPENFPKMAFFGDGSPIPPEDILKIDEVSRHCEHNFDWEEGDVVVVDNERVAHGRQAFEGERCVLVAMAMAKASFQTKITSDDEQC
jgi:alpha-ketoglutarate-dependent taurine dioxygenase